MDLPGFFQYYFVNPLFECTGYNIVNTFGFIVVLVILALVLKRVLDKNKIKFDESFFWMLFPYVLFGGILRSIEDFFEWSIGCEAARAANPWLVLLITPFIYLVLLAFVLVLLVLTRKFTKDYRKAMMRIGWALVIASSLFVIYQGINWDEFFLIMAFSGILCIIMAFAFKATNIYSKAGLLVAYGQLLDASATSLAVGLYGYGEQHVFTNMLLDVNPFLFVPVKMLLAFLVVYAVEKEGKKNKWKWLLFFVILMIGLAPGTRDVLRLLMGV